MKKYFLLIIIVISIIILYFSMFYQKPAITLASENDVCGIGEGCTINNKRKQGYNVGDQVPNIQFKKFDGTEVDLYDMLAGKDKFIISFAVDWCGDCERQNKKLNEYYNKLPNNYGAAVVYVDFTSADGSKTTNKKQALSYIENKQYVFPYFWDENNQISNLFGGIYATPTNIVLDENAIIKAKTEEIDMDILFETNEEDVEITF